MHPRRLGRVRNTIKHPLLIATLAVAACAHADAPPRPAPASKNALVAAAPPPPPPLSLVPADVARTALVGTFVIPALEGSLSAGVALVKQAAPLPLDPAGVRDMLLAQAGLPLEMGRHLDLTAPIAGAVVTAGPGRSPLTAFSFGCRSTADAAALLGALGRTIARRGAALQIENATGDRGWFLPQGTVVIMADSEEALVRAGSLAIEARRPGKDDVSLMFQPEVMARAAGTDVKTALDRMVVEMEERAAASGNKMGPEGSRQIREMADYLVGTSTVEIALSLDAARGAVIMLRLHPKPGSKLQEAAKQTKTIPIDPALLRAVASPKDDPGMVIASAYGGTAVDWLRRQRLKLPATGAGKATDAAGKLMDALADGLTGELSLTSRLQPSLSAESIYLVRDPASAGRIQAALASTTKESFAPILTAVTQGEAVSIKLQKARQEKVGKTRALHATFVVSFGSGANPAMGKVMGAGPVDLFMAPLNGNRVAMTLGPGAKARLVAIAAGEATPAPAPAPRSALSPALATAVAATSGRSLFYYFDLRQAVSAALAAMGGTRWRSFQAAAGAPMPILGGATGDVEGGRLTFDLTIPPSCFAGMGALVQAAMMVKN